MLTADFMKTTNEFSESSQSLQAFKKTLHLGGESKSFGPDESAGTPQLPLSPINDSHKDLPASDQSDESLRLPVKKPASPLKMNKIFRNGGEVTVGEVTEEREATMVDERPPSS